MVVLKNQKQFGISASSVLLDEGTYCLPGLSEKSTLSLLYSMYVNYKANFN